MSNTGISPVILLPLAAFLASAWLAGLGAFLFPLVMTALWAVRPVWRRLMLPRARAERFPGAFDFRPMLTIGLGLSLLVMAMLAD
jgi:hypothetical protein